MLVLLRRTSFLTTFSLYFSHHYTYYKLQSFTYMEPCFLHTHITHVCRLCIYSGSIWYHLNTLPQAGFDPLKQREGCNQSTTLPPSRYGWIISKYLKQKQWMIIPNINENYNCDNNVHSLMGQKHKYMLTFESGNP